MNNRIPDDTIHALARSISREAANYGFGQLDMVKLVNELMDYCTSEDAVAEPSGDEKVDYSWSDSMDGLPIESEDLRIRAFEPDTDVALLEKWLPDKYGRYFVLSSSRAQSMSIEELVRGERNHIAIITTPDGQPIGALAFLDHDVEQRRAELRKLIGEPEFRGKGIAEEATRLWIGYGLSVLDLEKIYVSTLQTHIGNIHLNEKVGFQVEGLLRDEVLIDGARHDVLRMGFVRGQGAV